MTTPPEVVRVTVVVAAVPLTVVLVVQVALEAAVVASTNGTYMIHSTIARPGNYQLRVGGEVTIKA